MEGPEGGVREECQDGDGVDCEVLSGEAVLAEEVVDVAVPEAHDVGQHQYEDGEYFEFAEVVDVVMSALLGAVGCLLPLFCETILFFILGSEVPTEVLREVALEEGHAFLVGMLLEQLLELQGQLLGALTLVCFRKILPAPPLQPFFRLFQLFQRKRGVNVIAVHTEALSVALIAVGSPFHYNLIIIIKSQKAPPVGTLPAPE